MISEDAVDDIDLGFTISGYPGTGRRSEDEVDLATCDRIELIQGAFMGDLKMKLGGQDFSTRFGCVTLLGWLLTLGDASHALQAAEEHTARFAESDDFISFRRQGAFLFVASSYRSGIARTQTKQFLADCSRFIHERLAWVASTYPACRRNRVMAEIVSKLEPGGLRS